MRQRQAAWAAATFAILSGLISLYWTLGGKWGLKTVGGAIATMATERTAAAILLGLITVLIKFAAAGFALLLVRNWLQWPPTQWVRRLGLGAGGSLFLYGIVNIVGGSLVLSQVITVAGADRYALKWHVFLWDAYFTVWGAVLYCAAWYYKPQQV